MKLYVAEFETFPISAHGYGETAITAVKALSDRWKSEWSTLSRIADLDFLENNRESIIVYEVDLRKGYVLGTHDRCARPIHSHGDDIQFDVVFQAPKPKMLSNSDWQHLSEDGMATNKDPVAGGIIDKAIVSGKWFVIPHNDAIPPIEELETKADAFAYLEEKLEELNNPGFSPGR